jgi:acetyl esterase/lipase
VSGPVIINYHGGGYCFGSARQGAIWQGAMIRYCSTRRTPLRILSVEYALANDGPDSAFPTGILQALAAYDWLLAAGVAPNRVFLMGDSAGGGLAFITALLAKHTGRPQPGGLLLHSPYVNLSVEHAEEATRALQSRHERFDFIDPSFLRRLATVYMRDIASTVPQTDPLISPGLADAKCFTGLPPTVVAYGGSELLAVQDEALISRLRSAGVNVLTLRHALFPHDFTSYPHAYGTDAADIMCDWLLERTSSATPSSAPAGDA